MAVAHDASSTATTGTGNLSWTHTPTGTPMGVLVMVVADVGVTNEVLTVTYGGITASQIRVSPLFHTVSTEDGTVYGFFLGSGLPTGAQTVSVTVNATASNKAACAVTLTANGDTEVNALATVSVDDTVNPNVTVLGAANSSQCYGWLHNGETDPATNLAPGAGMTELLEVDFGATSASFIRANSLSSGNTAMLWTNSVVQPWGIIGAAISEAGTPDLLLASEFRAPGLAGPGAETLSVGPDISL